MPHAKKEINPLWGLLAEPLFQIVAAVGLLLSGVLGLVGKLLGPILGPLVCSNHSSQSIDHLANNVFSLMVLVLVVCSMVFSEVLASRRSSAALVLVTSSAQSPVRNKRILMID
jgi:uncharacterized membrane protein YeaQ/YmgE (transglycosylase-associated protein family)